jgi:acetoin utilization protein AcuB
MQKDFDIKNLKVDAFTTPSPVVVKGEDSISKIITEMEKNGIRHLPVVDESDVAIGVITDRDVATVRAFAFNEDIKAADLMSDQPFSVVEGSSLVEAAYLMSDKKIGSLIVNDEHGKVAGIFTSTDALNALIEVLHGDILETE